MLEPDDFDLSPIATLAHVCPPVMPRHFAAFWTAWHDEVWSRRPALLLTREGSRDPSDPSADVYFESVRHVRIGGRLRLAPPEAGPARAVIVATHGYAGVGPLVGDDEDWAGLVARGAAVLSIRVRGFPGSAAETGVIGPGWICHGLDAFTPQDRPEDARNWILPQAVADVVNAVRALRRRFPGVPTFLAGESFGAGLCVMASALLPAGPADAEGGAPARLAICFPSLGDWGWRLSEARRARAGAGGEVAALVSSHAASSGARDAIMGRLRLCDSALHAPRVRCPALGGLALRDETVPAPSAAAVYNALGADPSRKWRFLLPVGHAGGTAGGVPGHPAGGGLGAARRYALFLRCREDFLDPALEPEGALRRWEPILADPRAVALPLA